MAQKIAFPESYHKKIDDARDHVVEAAQFMCIECARHRSKCFMCFYSFLIIICAAGAITSSLLEETEAQRRWVGNLPKVPGLGY